MAQERTKRKPLDDYRLACSLPTACGKGCRNARPDPISMTPFPPDDLVISDWVMAEFSAALSIKVRTGQLGPEHRAEALAVFRSMAELSLNIVSVSRMDFAAAARLSDQHTSGLRAGDALHLAIAANHGYRLVSLDRTLAQSGLELGVDARLL